MERVGGHRGAPGPLFIFSRRPLVMIHQEQIMSHSSNLVVALIFSVVLVAIAVTLIINGDTPATTGNTSMWYEGGGGILLAGVALSWLGYIVWYLYSRRKTASTIDLVTIAPAPQPSTPQQTVLVSDAEDDDDDDDDDNNGVISQLQPLSSPVRR